MYESRITRNTPTAFIFLIDQSGSMEEKVTIGSRTTSKAVAVAEVTNIMISELLFRSKRDDGIRDYFEIAVIGYGGQEAKLLMHNNNTFIKPSQLATMDVPLTKYVIQRVLPNGDTVSINASHPSWIKPKNEGSTPMYKALRYAYALAEEWCGKIENRDSYPMTIFNITDGEATDANEAKLNEIATSIKGLSTTDGNVLLINIHISATEYNSQVIFPSDTSQLPINKYAKTLYDMSSVMPSIYNDTIAALDITSTTPPFRGVCFNASVNILLSMMNIGSISVNLIH